jgi:hypothetical protein
VADALPHLNEPRDARRGAVRSAHGQEDALPADGQRGGVEQQEAS